MRTKKTIFCLGVVAVLIGTSCGSSPIKVFADNSAPVTIYSDATFQGASQDFEVGNYDIDVLRSGIGNDAITSMRVTPGYKVTVYRDEGFQGDSEVYTTNSTWLGMNDDVSSFRVEYAGEHLPVTLYSDSKFSGSSIELSVGSYDMSVLTNSIGNDSLSSLRVAPGYKVTLYKNSGFSGNSYVVTSDIYELSNFNDDVSSLIIEECNPVDATCIQVNSFDDQTKLSILRTFAPRIWMAQGETYWATSVEWVLPNLERYFNSETNTYCFRTVEEMSSATKKLSYFSGNQSVAKAYSFWTEKDYNNIDLTYWQFTPYDSGKVVMGSQFGAHISDWEHITVRLSKFTYNGVDYVKPVCVVYPYHAWMNVYNWNEVDKVAGTNHAIAYSAKGSHGMWKDPGKYVYKNIVVAKLTDECSAGTAMDCWNIMEPFEYYPGLLTGRGLNNNSWPAYFEMDYTNPYGQSAERWGNNSMGEVFGQAVLANGGNGPELHNTLYDWVVLK